MNEEPEKTEQVDIDPVEIFTTTTVCVHEYGSPIQVGELMEVVCTKCWHGCAFDPATMRVENGRLTANV